MSRGSPRLGRTADVEWVLNGEQALASGRTASRPVQFLGLERAPVRFVVVARGLPSVVGTRSEEWAEKARRGLRKRRLTGIKDLEILDGAVVGRRQLLTDLRQCVRSCLDSRLTYRGSSLVGE